MSMDCDGIDMYDYPGGVHCEGCPDHPDASGRARAIIATCAYCGQDLKPGMILAHDCPDRPLADPTETLALALANDAAENRHKILTQCGPPRDGYTLEQEILAQHEEQAAELETLALIAEFRLTVGPEGDGWWVAVAGNETVESFVGPTIADAVRECVSRIRGQQ
jgi:hypothetical protein